MFNKSIVTLILIVVTVGRILAQGASMPFRLYEAESGTTAGGATVLSMSALPSVPTVQLESSGRACVELNETGESVSWTTNETANAIVVRVSVPDAPAGGGITDSLNLYVNGVFRQTVVCTSKYSWIYGDDKMTDNNPSSGTPKRFYDMSRAFIAGDAVAAGSTITLRKDANNTAAYYRIDFILLENVGAPLTQPANTLSVVNYGAIPNDNIDDTQAFKNCISACQSQKKGMWIPPGNFHNGGSIINATGINIYGAGRWYTTNSRIIGARHKWNLTNCSIQDLYIFNPETGREEAQGHDSGMTIQGAKGWLVERVWTHHCFFWCSGTDGIIRNSLSTESWADGINLNNGPTVKVDYEGVRLTAQNNFIVGAGDDGIAINAQNGGAANANMVDTKVLNNTSIGVTWANGIRVAGGRNSLVQYNLITDVAAANGIRVGKFGTLGNDCESVLVADNLILRSCGIRTNYGQGGITVADTATATIQSNTIVDASRVGIDVQRCNAVVTENMIINPGSQGILIKSGSKGTGTFFKNTVSNLKSGQDAFRNDAPTSFTLNSWGNSWQPTGTENVHSENDTAVFVSNQNDLNIKGLMSLAKVQIFNVYGQILISTESNGKVDINKLSPGMYVILIDNRLSQKFLKN